MINNQLTQFFLYIVSGMAISIFFDIFRVLRKSIKTSNIITYIEDTIFWIIVGLFLIWEIFTISYGELRGYMFIGIILGIILYLLTISKFFININFKILIFLKKIILKIGNVIKNVSSHLLKFIKPFLILIRKPICFLFVNLRKLSNNFQPVTTKNLKNRKPKSKDNEKNINKKHNNLIKLTRTKSKNKKQLK